MRAWFPISAGFLVVSAVGAHLGCSDDEETTSTTTTTTTAVSSSSSSSSSGSTSSSTTGAGGAGGDQGPGPSCDAPAEAPSDGSCVTITSGAGGGGEGGGGEGGGGGAPPDLTSECNPVTNEPCDTAAGEACDGLQVEEGVFVFICYPPPNDGLLCDECDYSGGSFCAGTTTCAAAGVPTGTAGQCTRYCCSDADCGTGTCVTEVDGVSVFGEHVPDLGLCLTR